MKKQQIWILVIVVVVYQKRLTLEKMGDLFGMVMREMDLSAINAMKNRLKEFIIKL